MILVEIDQPSDRHKRLEKTTNVEWQKEEVNFLLEAREQAHLQNEKHKALIARATNKKMKVRSFPKGSLVLRWVDDPRRASKEGKLALN